jgi:predicted nuclease of restriction endonuclease-like (RecB) superfamily
MKKKSDNTLTISAEYRQFVEELKARVTAARISAARFVNGEAILLYWDIGRGIVEKQNLLGWGESVVEMVAADLHLAFPSVSGFSPRNLHDMKRFYLAYSDEAIWRQAVAKLETGGNSTEFLRQLVAEIPWGQNLLILNKLTNPPARLWYLRATARFGWSRNVLLNQIKASAYERAVTEKKAHDFDLTLPEHFAEQADEMLKSSYNLEFLGLR